ncbi:[acyl-carrier-protein] S-malonyltransferase [Bacillus sp. HMF5848]|nr:[acyl-carrier-protein] S-malonyltransferase [Bacillus sp. HMF5848]
MGQDIYDNFPEAASVFLKANDRLGFDLQSIIFSGPQESLTLTYHAQPALVTTSVAILETFKNIGITPSYTAGHSLGEYSALVAAGALSFEDAVYAVHKRGQFMEQAVPAGLGTMAAVLGLDIDTLQQVTNEASQKGEVVQPANINCPGQIVISGNREAVTLAGNLAKEKGAKRVIPLDVSGPFHSSLMQPAAEMLSRVLSEDIQIRDASIPVIANATAKPIQKAEDIHTNLVNQLSSPVLWEDSVYTMLEDGVDTFIEIGPGKVLSGLVKKINRRVTTYAVYDIQSLQEVTAKLKEAL